MVTCRRPQCTDGHVACNKLMCSRLCGIWGTCRQRQPGNTCVTRKGLSSNCTVLVLETLHAWVKALRALSHTYTLQMRRPAADMLTGPSAAMLVTLLPELLLLLVLLLLLCTLYVRAAWCTSAG
jgi:hypothetical protein